MTETMEGALHPALVKVIVTYQDEVLHEEVVETAGDEDLPSAIKAVLDRIRWRDRSLPLWGLGIKLVKPIGRL